MTHSSPDRGPSRPPSSHLSRALTVLRSEGVVFLILGALALFAAAIWYAVARSFDGVARGLLVGGLVSIAIYLILRPQDVRRVLTGRRVRYGSNAVVLSLAVTGIVVLVNYLSTRHYRRFDVTAGKLHTLSPQSVQIVTQIDSPIEVVGIYPGGQGQDAFERWLEAYRSYTDQIDYRTIDPIRQPGEADRLEWSAYGGGLLVRRGTRSHQVRTPDEQDITSALLRVSRDVSPVVYWSTGHGEPPPDGLDRGDYGQVASLLRANNYDVRTVNLAISDTVPSDAAAIVVAGLETPLLEGERAHLRSYLERGGRALIMLDPGVESGINDVLAPWQVRVENLLVVDLQRSLGGDPLSPVVDRYAFSQLTKDLPMLAFSLACPIVGPGETAADDRSAATFTSLAQTSTRSWAESDVSGESVQFDEGQDLMGPLTLLASVEAPAEEDTPAMRMVLVGDADLITNGNLAQIPNGQFLFLNAVHWLVEEEELIAIGPKVNVPQTVRMDGVQEGAVCLGSLILIPAVVVIAGIVVWLKRR